MEMKDCGEDDTDMSDVQVDDVWSYNTDTGRYNRTSKYILKNHHHVPNYVNFLLNLVIYVISLVLV